MKQNTRWILTLSLGMILPQMSLAQQKPKEKPAPSPNRGKLPSRGGGVRRTQDETIIPMIFPVLGKVDWSDTYNLDSTTSKRVHHGQDLMAPKMRPLIAVFDGVVEIHPATPTTPHNRLNLFGDNGYTAKYMHINIDTPGTNDGNGGDEYAFVAGLKSGDHVIAGQLLAWVGNSGNARGGDPHCHFELCSATGTLNPCPSLKAAQHIETPIVNLRFPDIRPKAGEMRLDGMVRTFANSGDTLTLSLLSTLRPGSTALATLSPKRLEIKLGQPKIVLASNTQTPKAKSDIREGSQVILIAKEGDLDQIGEVRLLAFDETKEPPRLPTLPTFAPKRAEPQPKPAPITTPPNTEAPKQASAPDPAPFAPTKKGTKYQLNEAEQRLLERLNRERKERGLSELTLSLTLAKVARTYTKSMIENNSFSHLGSDSSLPDERVKRAGYTALAIRENISQGLAEPDAILEQWVKQERLYHLNLLDPEMKEIGVGYAEATPKERSKEKTPFWTILFANPTK